MQKISVSQALLLYIEHLKKQHQAANTEDKRNLEEQINELGQLYLVGANNDTNSKKIENYLNLFDETLNNNQYLVSRDWHVINNDPTRRYFETHLAMQTNVQILPQIQKEDISAFKDAMLSLMGKEEDKKKLVELTEFVFSKRSYHEKITLTPDTPEKEKAFIDQVAYDNRYKEYAFACQLIDEQIKDAQANNDDVKIDILQKERLLVENAALAIALVNVVKNVPIDIYEEGYYQDKGILDKHGYETPGKAAQYGIMKSSMPLPHGDAALAPDYPYLKSSEKNKFADNTTSSWIRDNFKQLVHPWSASISGTTLCQLRSLAATRTNNNDLVISGDDLQKYMQTFVATMLHFSGGHTLNEFVTPIGLAAVKKVLGFGDEMTLLSLFNDKNKAAFDNTLQDTLNYNRQLLNRKKTQDSFEQSPILSRLQDVKYNDRETEFNRLILNGEDAKALELLKEDEQIKQSTKSVDAAQVSNNFIDVNKVVNNASWLYKCIRNDCQDTACKLIELHANVLGDPKNITTAAINLRKTKIVDTLAQHGYINNKYIETLLNEGNIQRAIDFIKKGVKPDCLDEDKNNLIMMAIEKADKSFGSKDTYIELINVLLAHNVSINHFNIFDENVEDFVDRVNDKDFKEKLKSIIEQDKDLAAKQESRTLFTPSAAAKTDTKKPEESEIYSYTSSLKKR